MEMDGKCVNKCLHVTTRYGIYIIARLWWSCNRCINVDACMYVRVGYAMDKSRTARSFCCCN